MCMYVCMYMTIKHVYVCMSGIVMYICEINIRVCEN